MNRAELIDKLGTFPFDKKEYWLIAGGAMVFYGFKEETKDIDLGCSTKLADQLQEQGYETTIMKDGTRRIGYSDEVEIFENWLSDTVEVQMQIPVVSVTGLIQMKRELGREKDLLDISCIEKALAKEG